MRKCPNCCVRIQKYEGCPSMTCERCDHSFCWCCMRSLKDKKHDTWYRLCPKLSSSYCCNILTTLIFFIFLPVFLLLGPLLAITIHIGFYKPRRNTKQMKCCKRVLIFFMHIVVLLPICLVIGLIAAIVISVIAILPLYYYTFVHFCRLIYIGCRYKL